MDPSSPHDGEVLFTRTSGGRVFALWCVESACRSTGARNSRRCGRQCSGVRWWMIVSRLRGQVEERRDEKRGHNVG